MRMSELQMLEYMQRLPEEKRPAFQMAWSSQKKNADTALILSLLWLLGLCGIGRMYAGDIGLGIAMLLLGPLTCFLWPLIDLFLIRDSVDRSNQTVLIQLQAVYPVSR